MLKKTLILLTLFCSFYSFSFCQQNYWQQQVNYNINITLNDSSNTLDGYMKMEYFNNSPDTLQFIWMHLWANAFKNDYTAYSDQLLQNGRTDFYFSDEDKYGYINRLNFKVNGITAEMEDHPQHQDIVKLKLPHSLPPHSTINISTPFHIQLPYNFSGDGYTGKSYQITQWFPKPAVYDKKGWHEMPYLDQGGNYNEFGNYDVTIRVPSQYIVASNGMKMDDSTTNGIKTLHYIQNNITDFVWMMDKKFLVQHDTIQLASGKTIDAFVYYKEKNADKWKSSMQLLKQAVITKSEMIGDYPYNIISLVENTCKKNEAAFFPGLDAMKSSGNSNTMEFMINHLVGYNWFGGAIANNERQEMWMSKGMNTYYDDKQMQDKNRTYLQMIDPKKDWLQERLPDDPRENLLQTMVETKKDQPIETPADSFSLANYYLIGYIKSAQWFDLTAQNSFGANTPFNNAMKEYYKHWQFKHPYPEDLKQSLETSSGKSLDSPFNLLNKKGWLGYKDGIINPSHEFGSKNKKDIKLSSFFNFKETDQHNYIFVSPAIGYNFYDKLMFGAVIHNYALPLSKLQYLIAPLYATGSSQLNGLGRLSYSWFPGMNGEKIDLSVAASTFSSSSFTDSTGSKKDLRFVKIVPSLKIIFPNKDPRGFVTKFIQWKTFFISEQGYLFSRDTITQADTVIYPTSHRYVNQLRFVLRNDRRLYPFMGELEAEQGDGFARATFTGNYYFNYEKKGGMDVRLFIGKFFSWGNNFYTDPYQLNMTGPRGYEDFTYSDYYVGRNEFEGVSSQQIMKRDGFFKVGTDLLGNKVGKTDNWLAAVNFTSDIPKSVNPLQILPVKIPKNDWIDIKAFLDIGTYGKSSLDYTNTDPHLQILYDAGVQLCLLKNVINIYVPLLYSSAYKDYYTSYVTGNKLFKSISFSIDLQNIQLKKYFPQISF